MSKSMRQTIETIIKELRGLFSEVKEEEVKNLVSLISTKRKNRVYLIGQGRTGLMGRAFAVRLMHLGFNAFVAGETITPAVEKSDLVIACSGSGETGVTCYLTGKAKDIGAKIVAVTAKKDSKLARMADLVVVVPGTPKFTKAKKAESIQHPGSLFEQGLLMLLDATAVLLKRKTGTSSDGMNVRHANLE